MNERTGQYYFEVNQGEFVNNGKMIELNSRGSERFSWKKTGTGLIVMLTVVGVGGVSGAGIVEILQGTPLAEVMESKISDSDVGLFVIGLFTGIAVASVATIELSERLKRIRIKRSFIRN